MFKKYIKTPTYEQVQTKINEQKNTDIFHTYLKFKYVLTANWTVLRRESPSLLRSAPPFVLVRPRFYISGHEYPSTSECAVNVLLLFFNLLIVWASIFIPGTRKKKKKKWLRLSVEHDLRVALSSVYPV